MDNLQRLREFAAEDPSLPVVLIGLFLEQAPQLLADIEQAAMRVQPEATKRAAHTLKGVCLNLGFDTAADVTKQIEVAALANDFKLVHAQIKTLAQELNALYKQLAVWLPAATTT